MSAGSTIFEPAELAGDPDVQRCLAALRAMYDHPGPDAVDALRPVLDASFTFTPAGTSDSALQQTYVGAEGFTAFLERQAALTDDSWWPEVQTVRVGPEVITVAVIARPRRRDGLRAEFGIVHRWTRRADTLVSFVSHTEQQQEYDRFHAHDADHYGGTGSRS
ncbi:hypothetical protein JL107_15725 [Nakamurella flavida]|uniref:Uncharacterized protein n=1 Tax=Nakamurella flavida TaxID=363630 RepID=A0A938YR32_9ACTN|nr:hypothetical protein [Nakamurella flavida]MBM9477897.1 hypothetical protein [Nakamurella flavida]MDP9778389.1 hypothetical protein [Nakamurella flavida]